MGKELADSEVTVVDVAGLGHFGPMFATSSLSHLDLES